MTELEYETLMLFSITKVFFDLKVTKDRSKMKYINSILEGEGIENYTKRLEEWSLNNEKREIITSELIKKLKELENEERK